MKRYTLTRSLNVRQHERWTIDTEVDLADMLETESVGKVDTLVCDLGNLESTDIGDVDDDGLDLTIEEIENLDDEPDWNAFVEQNTEFMVGLSDTSEMVQYAGHHSGGLVVLSRPIEIDGQDLYVKAHDSWGGEHEVVVHIYDPDGDETDTYGVVTEFDTRRTIGGAAAWAVFINDDVLTHIWRGRTKR